MTVPCRVQAQTREKAGTDKLPHPEKKYTVSLHPLYHLYNGVRIDFEKRIKNTPSWIQAGIAGHWLSAGNHDYNYGVMISGDELNRLRGAGMELNYKRFINRAQSLYFAGGCSYSFYGIKYAGSFWSSYTENGLAYHVKKYYRNIDQRISKLGVSGYFGYQIPLPVFLFDMFAGIGYRHSIRSNSAANRYNDNMLSLGYTGVVFITGVRLGVKL